MKSNCKYSLVFALFVGIGAMRAPAENPAVPIRVSGGVMAGLLLTNVMPVFPAAAQCESSRVVMLHAIIGADGRVKNLSLISGQSVNGAVWLEARLFPKKVL